MIKVYGSTLLYSDGDNYFSMQCQRWDAVVRLNDKHYVLPGDSVGQYFVDVLATVWNIKLFNSFSYCFVVSF